MALDINRLEGANVVDQNGDKIGSVGQIYLDDQSNEPTFATVKTGLFGTKETFVPLHEASEGEGDLRVPYAKEFVKDAPNIDADAHLSEQEQDEIYRYYQMGGDGDGRNAVGGGRDRGDRVGQRDDAAYGQGTDRLRDDAALAGDSRVDYDRTDADRGAGDRVADSQRGRGDATGDNLSRRDEGRDDASMTLREEQLNVGTERVERGRARLRKYVVTEQRTVTVPVEREEVELVREPVDGDGRQSGADSLGDEEQTVTLSEERPVVDKQVVDKERVGLQTNTVTDERQVTADVGREEVAVDKDDADRGDRAGRAGTGQVSEGRSGTDEVDRG